MLRVTWLPVPLELHSSSLSALKTRWAFPSVPVKCHATYQQNTFAFSPFFPCSTLPSPLP